MNKVTELQPGRDLDRMIASNVLKLTVDEAQLPHFSTEISDAFGLVEQMCRDKGHGREHFSLFMFTNHWKAMFGTPDLRGGDGHDEVSRLRSATTAPMAICLAALDATKTPRD
jgi:hypothetical protein